MTQAQSKNNSGGPGMNPGCYNQPHVANKGIILFRGRHYDTGEGEGERYTEVTHPSCSICKPAGNQHD